MEYEEIISMGREIALRPFREDGAPLAGIIGVNEGTAYVMRSESSDCICCEGRHVHGMGVRLDGEHPEVSMWVRHLLYPFKHEMHGKRVRVTVEFLP